jgi:hypothetical protein
MEVHFTPEQEAQLSQIASHAGTNTERLVKDAVVRLLEQDARFRAAVREGIAQADRALRAAEKLARCAPICWWNAFCFEFAAVSIDGLRRLRGLAHHASRFRGSD